MASNDSKSKSAPEAKGALNTRNVIIVAILVALLGVAIAVLRWGGGDSTSNNSGPTASAGRTVVPATGEVARPPKKSTVVYDGDTGDFRGEGDLRSFKGWWLTGSGNRFDLECAAPGDCSASLQGYDLDAVLVPYEDGDRIKWSGHVVHTRRGKIKTKVSF